jgi:hypothetical protein
VRCHGSGTGVCILLARTQSPRDTHSVEEASQRNHDIAISVRWPWTSGTHLGTLVCRRSELRSFHCIPCGTAAQGDLRRPGSYGDARHLDYGVREAYRPARRSCWLNRHLAELEAVYTSLKVEASVHLKGLCHLLSQRPLHTHAFIIKTSS